MSKHYQHKLKDVAKSSGLTYDYINKVLKKLPEYFESEQSRGANNSRLLSDNALILFQKIADLRNQGIDTIPAIRAKLEELNTPTSKKEVIQTDEPPSKPPIPTGQNDKVETVQPDSQTVETIKGVYEERIKDLKQTLSDKEQNHRSQTDDLRSFHTSIEEELKNRIKLLDEPAEVKAQRLQNKQRRREVVNELNNLDGKLFVGKKRKELLKELSTLV